MAYEGGVMALETGLQRSASIDIGVGGGLGDVHGLVDQALPSEHTPTRGPRSDRYRRRRGTLDITTTIVTRRAHTRVLSRSRGVGERRLLEMVAEGSPLAEIFNVICRFVEDQISECRCGIYLIDDSGVRLRSAASPNLPQVVNDEICDKPVRTELGPCAQAMYQKKQVIIGDLISDQLWRTSQFADTALMCGFRSCWSTPILAGAARALGMLVILQCNPALPTRREQDLICKISCICSMAIDRAQKAAAFKLSEAFLAETQRLAAIGSFFWRVATDEITGSEQLYRIYQFQRDVPLTLELIASRVHPDDLASMNDMISKSLQGGGEIDYEYRLLMPDHSVKSLRMVARGIRDQLGRLQYIGAVQDVTERQFAEEALTRATSELSHMARVTSLGELAASIAHEVSQPLTGMIANASTCLRMLGGDSCDIEGARELARRVLRDGSRASAVIKRLRELFARKAAKSEAVDLNEAAREMVAMTMSELNRKRVSLQLELAHDLPLIRGDCVQLQQVVLNLIRNAVDSMSCVDDRPRELVIKTHRDDDNCVQLTVKDTGGGFDPGSIGRLFDPFYTTKTDGMGIGLSVSRAIIERHQGRVWATRNDGAGATFAFSIPIRLKSEASASYPEQDTPARRGVPTYNCANMPIAS